MQMPIRSLQSMLRLLQRHAGKPTTVVPDGIFGPETARAVREFQQQNGLPVTGAADLMTWNAVVDAAREAHIAINFRPTPHAIYRTPLGAANRLVIHLQPRDGLDLHLFAAAQAPQAPAMRAPAHAQSAALSSLALPPSPALQMATSAPLSPVLLDMDFDQRFGAQRVGAYERLLLDVLAGRLNLFVRSDEQEAAWGWVEPILHAWQHAEEGPRLYSAGTWGPSAASALVARDTHCWTEEC